MNVRMDTVDAVKRSCVSIRTADITVYLMPPWPTSTKVAAKVGDPERAFVNPCS